MNVNYVFSDKELMKLWDFDKNRKLDPKIIKLNSRKKAFWKCENNHEWEGCIRDRAKSNGCPFCKNKRLGYGNDALTHYPEIMQDWDYSQNEKNPEEVIYVNRNYHNWKCIRGHKDTQRFDQRLKKGCLKCSSIKYKSKHLMKEWDYERNVNMNPEDFLMNSDSLVNWVCSNNNEHKWKQTIKHRVKFPKCPYCNGTKIGKDNNLKIKYPELMNQWDYKKNKCCPSKYSPSSKEVWWKCTKSHLEKKSINQKIKNQKCSYCNYSKIGYGNDLKNSFPNLMAQWDYKKNININPEMLSHKSKKKVWWNCFCGNNFKAAINERLNKDNEIRSCRNCSGKGMLKTKKLFDEYPDLIDLWDYKKNVDINPSELTSGSNRLVFWSCKCGYKFEKKIYEVVKSKCIKCNSKIKRINYQNKSNKINILEKEWDYEKNKGSIFDCNISSKEKVWWKCLNGHSWKAPISRRFHKNTNCPNCFSNTSKKELLIFSELKYIFSNVELGNKIFGKEIDVFLKDFNIGIEYDGCYWHRNKLKKDKEKHYFFRKKKIRIINIREFDKKHKLKQVSNDDIIDDTKNNDIEIIFKILKKLLEDEKIKNKFGCKIKKYIKTGELKNESFLANLLSGLASKNPIKKEQFPHLFEEWDDNKNSPFKIEAISMGSKTEYWWKCSKKHYWKASMNQRTNNKSGCPYCAGQRVGQGTELSKTNPSLLKKWDYKKNIITPDEITNKYNKKVWWKCEKEHSFEASVRNQVSKFSCYICDNKIVHSENNFELLHKELSKQWDYEKNGDLKPNNISPNNGKKIHWICPSKNNCKWEMKLSDRIKTFYSNSNSKGCPYCMGRKIGYGNDLKSMKVDLIKEWDYKKNKVLPEDVFYKAIKSVWWICKNGHSWKESIKKRVEKTSKDSKSKAKGCPYCECRKVGYGNDLLSKRPDIAKDWDFVLNKNLKPSDILYLAHKDVFWKCNICNHKWKSSPNDRIIKNKCCQLCKKSK